MADLTGKNVLFFSPRFFNYEVEIQNALIQAGANVMWFDERPSNSFTTKVIIRLYKKLIKQKIARYFESVLKQVLDSGVCIDFILIISPETITPKQLKDFKMKFKNAKIILYMWDSLKNKGAIDLLSIVDSAITFDPRDAEKFNLKLHPLFYIDQYKFKNCEQYYELLFIGTAHSDRYNFVKGITANLPDSKTKLFFFLSSKKLYWSKRFFDKDFKNVKLEDISFDSLTHIETVELMQRSQVILDVNHPEQIGLTMRTFETLGAQKKLITTNQDIVRYDFYDENNIMVIDRVKPFICSEFIMKPFKPSSKDILEKYSIHGWLNELFKGS
ncbi:hypothetical protein AQ505_02150 [Pedobacter sp. PACM 27299]|uniref:hypothetical protein n=1 Tax=Pedobacter sp. PACM 27299 TaxID=1727164 RepID=UPI0007056BEB|nr:hypothetical protein [Pedobacter sp. PACM 27299]ALL04404.1 hypothetical protein AQ505_02150 [Pedobacter sp. PACM 27299]